MLIHLVGILSLASVSVTDVPSRLFAVSHLKGIINEVRNELKDFKMNMTMELTKLETGGRSSHKNDTACEKRISQAYNETRKLLNMLVEGDHNGLETAETSLENMTLNEISQLWGSLAPGGKSKVKVQKEMDDFRKTATARITEAINGCKTPVNPQKSSAT